MHFMKLTETVKFGLLAVLISIPLVAYAPATDNTPDGEILTDGYYTVMAFEGLFDDRFEIYIFGLAQKVKVYNKAGLDIPYNKKVYFKLDKKYRILDIRTAQEMKQALKNR